MIRFKNIHVPDIYGLKLFPRSGRISGKLFLNAFHDLFLNFFFAEKETFQFYNYLSHKIIISYAVEASTLRVNFANLFLLFRH